jgi:hypothetical protein
MTLISYDNQSKVIRHRYKKEGGEWKNFADWILEYNQYDYPKDLEKVSQLILNNLETKFCPKKYREKNKTNPLFGYCYVSTQALYYFFKDKNLTIMKAVCEIADAHWWLQDGDTIIDITADQYTSVGRKPPYDKGKETKWYGWKNRPHKISLELMNKVQPTSYLYHIKKGLDIT